MLWRPWGKKPKEEIKTHALEGKASTPETKSIEIEDRLGQFQPFFLPA